ncbi:hypothetical protein P3C22_08700 [Pseudomonas sp. ER28]|uniref:hypothetical protein n=1 Tax=Pseudomonas TaxID=286 RepID=UPI0007DC20E5|nr:MULTISPECIES: hypothetical protein [Pseudomonas]MBP2262041.1 hypothetical protein [Pseudomonas sp. BP8]MDF3172131.1 hypothetical protein [Pseudomonas sp. ER28]NQD55898.1 hypothetical protein [Pseudomonas sp. CM25]NQD76131.1 hypothetical protein [Pseudomonas sp. CM27]OAS04597.1 hypothetical protein AYO08_14665 [Pseudomonas putida]
MKRTDDNTGDKVPQPLASEQAQRGEQVPGPVLKQPEPETEAVDKVITPTSIKEQAQQTQHIKQRLAEVEEKKQS